MRGLGAYLQHGLGVMLGEIAAETGRLSASVPTPRRSSSRLGSGLLITTVVVQAYKEAGQTDRRAGMHAAGTNRVARCILFCNFTLYTIVTNLALWLQDFNKLTN